MITRFGEVINRLGDLSRWFGDMRSWFGGGERPVRQNEQRCRRRERMRAEHTADTMPHTGQPVQTGRRGMQHVAPYSMPSNCLPRSLRIDSPFSARRCA